MGTLRKLEQAELAQELNLDQADVQRYVSDNEPKADDSGHWVYFKVETPKSILTRLKVGKNLVLDLR